MIPFDVAAYHLQRSGEMEMHGLQGCADYNSTGSFCYVDPTLCEVDATTCKAQGGVVGTKGIPACRSFSYSRTDIGDVYYSYVLRESFSCEPSAVQVRCRYATCGTVDPAESVYSTQSTASA